jgi:aspartate racemase
MSHKIIGIVGGMGPEATANFYLKLIKRTPAKKDQDHHRVIIDSNPKIPDRTLAILGRGESPVPSIIETAQNLSRAGVTIGCIPCITSHFFFDEVQANVNFQLIHALRALNAFCHRHYPHVKTLGILATTGTINTGLYNQFLSEFDIVYPDPILQEKNVMEAIYGCEGIKSGNHGSKPLGLLRMAANKLVAQGAELIIAGCTEIPIILKQEHLDVPLIDPMDVVIDILLEIETYEVF